MSRDRLPPAVRTSLSQSVRDYWFNRVRQHTADSYAGIVMAKFPEDLRVYEHLLWASRANAVIELGTWHGGSALWFRDRLAAYARYRPGPRPLVVSIDVTAARARRNVARLDPEYERTIMFIEADVTNPALPERVRELLPPESRCLVVEDSRHVYETTLAALRGFARFVPHGGFFVVEDGSVDIEEMRPGPDWPRGVLPAVRDWLATPDGRAFEQRRDLELYGVTAHPEGFLQRVQPDSPAPSAG